jgi:hypothetical protein
MRNKVLMRGKIAVLGAAGFLLIAADAAQGQRYFTLLRWPISGTTEVRDTITSPFGFRINNGAHDYHLGVDLRTRGDRAVHTATCCVVIDGGSSPSMGRYLDVRYKFAASGWVVFRYLHLSAYAFLPGDEDSLVTPWYPNCFDTIAYTGTSGDVSPHLDMRCQAKTSAGEWEPESKPMSPLLWYELPLAMDSVPRITDTVVTNCAGGGVDRVTATLEVGRRELDRWQLFVHLFNKNNGDHKVVEYDLYTADAWVCEYGFPEDCDSISLDELKADSIFTVLSGVERTRLLLYADPYSADAGVPHRLRLTVDPDWCIPRSNIRIQVVDIRGNVANWYGSCCFPPIRGNANGDPDDEVNVVDITFLLDWMFGDPSGPAPVCMKEANANGDVNERVNLSDLTYLIDYLFGVPSGPPPPACP